MGLIRRGRPVVRTVARTAVIAGTATAVSGRVQRRQQGKWSEQEQAPQAEAAPAPAADGGADDTLDQLQKLAGLKDQGVLTEEEFAAEKAKILAGG
jgi:Short C-terminal domain